MDKGKAEPFQETVLKHCPSGVDYYFMARLGPDGEPIRHPPDRALRCCNPFEMPVGAKAAQWMVIYCKDQSGRVIAACTHPVATLGAARALRAFIDGNALGGGNMPPTAGRVWLDGKGETSVLCHL
jgi:hypothetical protein